jgi:hypothetical protein
MLRSRMQPLWGGFAIFYIYIYLYIYKILIKMQWPLWLAIYSFPLKVFFYGVPYGSLPSGE